MYEMLGPCRRCWFCNLLCYVSEVEGCTNPECDSDCVVTQNCVLLVLFLNFDEGMS